MLGAWPIDFERRRIPRAGTKLALYHGSGAETVAVTNNTTDTLTIYHNIPNSTSTATIAVGATGTFSIPDLSFIEPKTPREAMEAANAYHAWRLKVDVDKRIVFGAMPTAPLFDVGEWTGAEFQDASANAGEEIYSRVLVQATGSDGQPMHTWRTQAAQTGVTVRAITSPAADNPSFAADVASWTATSSVITRDTATLDALLERLSIVTGQVR